MRAAFVTATRIVAVGLVLGTLLAGCGRRGALEPPPGGKALPDDEAAETRAGEPDRFGGKKRQPIQKPKDPFVLDPLL